MMYVSGKDIIISIKRNYKRFNLFCHLQHALNSFKFTFDID